MENSGSITGGAFSRKVGNSRKIGKKFMVTRMRGKGQVTIPLKIREPLRLRKGSILSVAKVGDGILLVPKPSAFESFAARFQRAAEEKKITLRSLLKDLRKIRAQNS